jgi:hypothetical protein
MAYNELKIYASGLLAYGLEKLATETVAKYANGETHEALAGKLFDRKTSVPRDPASAEQIDFNAGQTNNQYLLTLRTHEEYDEHAEVLPLTACMTDTVQAALESYTSLINSVEFDFKTNAWTLRVAADDTPIASGFEQDADGYDSVTLPPGVVFQKAEQNKVLFAVEGAAMKKLCRVHKLDYFKKIVVSYLEYNFPKHDCSVPECHILFAFSNYVHFAYHQDSKDLTSGSAVKLSFIFDISPGCSSMSVAGYNEFVYKFPGACAAFYSDLFHASGEAEMRTVKVAFFAALSLKAASSSVFLKDMDGTTTTEGKPAAEPAVPPPAAVDPPPEVAKGQEQKQEQELLPEQKQEQERERKEDEGQNEDLTALQPADDRASDGKAAADDDAKSSSSDVNVSATEESNESAAVESFKAASGDSDDKQPDVSGEDSTPAADGQTLMQKEDKVPAAVDPERTTVPAAPAVATADGATAGRVKHASFDSSAKKEDGGTGLKRKAPSSSTRAAAGK